MPIERSRSRFRTPGPIAPRPDGISRRVAGAARDRQLGPLPEQRPTGWHRLVYDNPPRPQPPVGSSRPADPDVAARPSRDPAAQPESARRVRPEPDAVAVDVPAARPGRSVRAAAGDHDRAAAGERAHDPGTGGMHRTADRPRQQIGRVLDPRPARGRRTALLATAVGVAAAAGAAAAAVLLMTAAPAPSEPADPPAGPASVTRTSPPVVSARPPVVAPATADAPARPATTELPASAGPVSVQASAGSAVVQASAGPAVVSTLTPGDPGFGWPSTAFGSAPAG